MEPEERIEAASKFLLQSPPGEINDVLNDVRNIISDDDNLQTGILPALREYNLAQLITAEVPGHQYQTIVSEAAHLPSQSSTTEGDQEINESGEASTEEHDRFWDPRSHTSYQFDHLSLEASDPRPVEPDAESEPFRAAIEAAALSYISSHYQSGVAAVFPVPSSASKFILQIVANKYNPANFWSGRWRSEYNIDLDTRSVEGRIFVNVHYYEQGNVQLSTSHTVSFSLPPALSVPASSSALSAKDTAVTSAASKLLALISAEETRFQTSLNSAYSEMGERTFKGLRRALPMTRAKMDWDKVLGYKLGAELGANKGGFGSISQAA